MRDIVLMTIVAVFSSIGLVRPLVGILLFSWLAFFSPQSYVWGFGKTFPLSQVAAIGTIAGCFLGRETKRFPWCRESILLLALWAVFGVSSIFALYPAFSFELFFYLSKMLLMVFLTMLLINDKSRLEMFLRVAAISMGLYGLKAGIFVLASGGEQTVYGPEQSFLAANNSIGLALAINVPLLYYLWKTETRKWLRWLVGAMMFLSIPAVICTFSRGAWLGLGVAAGMLVLRSKQRFMIMPVAGILAGFLFTAVPQLIPVPVAERFFLLEHYEVNESAESRFWNWEFCKRVGLARPITGGGIAFSSIETYATYYPEFLDRWPGKVWTCHSIWFGIFGGHGFPGIMIWVGLLISCMLSLRQMRAYARTYPDLAWIGLLAECIQTALLAYMVVGTFLDAQYFDLFYYLVALVTIVRAIVGNTLLAALSASANFAAAGRSSQYPIMGVKDRQLA